MYGFGGTHAFWPAGTKRPHKHLAFRRFRPSERAWECGPPTVDSQEGFLVQLPRATEPTGNTDDLGTFQVAPVGQARLPPMTLHAADEGVPTCPRGEVCALGPSPGVPTAASATVPWCPPQAPVPSWRGGTIRMLNAPAQAARQNTSYWAVLTVAITSPVLKAGT